MDAIVIDTNIFISALIKEGLTRKILTDSKLNFLFPEFEFEELNKNKEEILKKTGINRREFYILFLRLLRYVRVIPTDVIINYREEADEIIGNIDKDDVIFIATALAFSCFIWSNDKHFQKQNTVKVLTTKDMLSLIK